MACSQPRDNAARLAVIRDVRGRIDSQLSRDGRFRRAESRVALAEADALPARGAAWTHPEDLVGVGDDGEVVAARDPIVERLELGVGELDHLEALDAHE